MPALFEHYRKFRHCITKLIVKTKKGDLATGTGFHIGDGLIVTAKHNLEKTTLDTLTSETTSQLLSVESQLTHPDDDIDLLVLKTDFVTVYTANHSGGKPPSAIPLGDHLNNWMKDEFILSKVLLMGYPKIPRSGKTFLVTTEAEVNAVVTMYLEKHPYFILSSTARGGFSGGPVITADGRLLGVVVRSLMSDRANETTGYCAALTVQPLYEILKQLPTRPACVKRDVWEQINIPSA